MWPDPTQVLALLIGLFAAMAGTAFFVVGLLPGPSAPWWKQYGLAAFALTVAWYALRYALFGFIVEES